MDWDAEHPLLLDSPRVWRTYLGGALLDEMHGAAPGEGAAGHFPEEWLFSTVRANNPGRPGPADPEEGLSHVAGELRLPAEGRFSGRYLLEGEGEALCGGKALPVRAPQQVFVPAACGDITLRARAPMRLLQCFGPGENV